jgi:hypothetical protein
MSDQLPRYGEEAGSATGVVAQRAAGLCGLAGGCIFFAGDMLMYGHFGAASDLPSIILKTVREVALKQLFFGGLVGPVAACLCTLGFWHVYRNLTPGLIRLAILVLSATSMSMLGAVHVLWVAKGLLKRECLEASIVCSRVASQVNDYWNTAYYLGVIPAYIACALLALMIIAKRSIYPRWTLIFNPALSIFVAPALIYVPGPLGAPLAGGDSNLFIVFFFIVSVLTTWSAPPRTQPVL